jgi:hypothetical protein
MLLGALHALMNHGTPALPAGADALWRCFVDLCATRQWADGRPCPITYQEIDAYCRVMGAPLEPRHVQILRRLDLAWLKHTEDPTPTERPTLTPDAFDAVFR